MRTLTYEKDGKIYTTLATAPKGAQVVLTRDKEKFTGNERQIKARREAIRNKTTYQDYVTPGTDR